MGFSDKTPSVINLGVPKENFSTALNNITNIESLLYTNKVTIRPQWEIGTLLSLGEESESATRLRTIDYIRTKSTMIITPEAGYSVLIKYFDENLIYKSGTAWLVGENRLFLDYPYIRLIFKKNDESVFTSPVANISIICEEDMLEVQAFPQISTTLNENDDLMSHVSNLFADPVEKGVFYSIYYHDKTTIVESSTNPNTSVSLVRFSVSNPYLIERFNILSPGDTIDTFVQDSIAVREPNLYVDSDYVYCFVLCKNIGETSKYHVIRFNKLSKTIVDIQPLLLDALPIQGTIASAIIKHSDGYFYTGWGAYTAGFNGLIIRSLDLVNWETYATLPFGDIGTGYVNEISIAFDGDYIHVVSRVQGGLLASGIYMHRYNTSTLSFEYRNFVLGSKASKSFIIKYNGSILIFYNSAPDMITDWGKPDRSRTRIEPVNLDGTYSLVGTIVYECGIHYYSIINYYGSLYMTFTSDPKKFSLSCKGSICFMPVIARNLR